MRRIVNPGCRRTFAATPIRTSFQTFPASSSGAEENGIVLSFGIYGNTRAEQQRRCQDQNWRGGGSAEQLAPERCVRCRLVTIVDETTGKIAHVANEAGTRCVPC